MELCLGTVQFGMDYGVFEQKKKEPDYCIRCLDYATQNGIRAIDTATAYGIAEQITGEFLRRKTIDRNQLFLSTKLLPNILDECDVSQYANVIRQNLIKSLQTLHTDYVDAYFLHSARYAFHEDILEALSTVKQEGLAKEVGVSVYEPEEAMACIRSKYVGYIQAPYSIFDHRMKEKGVFDEIDIKKCKIDIRTVFVKGLVKLQVDEVPKYLERAKPVLEKLDRISEETGCSRIELAMNYVKRETKTEHLVFGIRDMEQLKTDIKAFESEMSDDIFERMNQEFSGIDADIVIPSLWKK